MKNSIKKNMKFSLPLIVILMSAVLVLISLGVVTRVPKPQISFTKIGHPDPGYKDSYFNTIEVEVKDTESGGNIIFTVNEGGIETDIEIIATEKGGGIYSILTMPKLSLSSTIPETLVSILDAYIYALNSGGSNPLCKLFVAYNSGISKMIVKNLNKTTLIAIMYRLFDQIYDSGILPDTTFSDGYLNLSEGTQIFARYKSNKHRAAEARAYVDHVENQLPLHISSAIYSPMEIKLENPLNLTMQGNTDDFIWLNNSRDHVYALVLNDKNFNMLLDELPVDMMIIRLDEYFRDPISTILAGPSNTEIIVTNRRVEIPKIRFPANEGDYILVIVLDNLISAEILEKIEGQFYREGDVMIEPSFLEDVSVEVNNVLREYYEYLEDAYLGENINDGIERRKPLLISMAPVGEFTFIDRIVRIYNMFDDKVYNFLSKHPRLAKLLDKLERDKWRLARGVSPLEVIGTENREDFIYSLGKDLEVTVREDEAELINFDWKPFTYEPTAVPTERTSIAPVIKYKRKIR